MSFSYEQTERNFIALTRHSGKNKNIYILYTIINFTPQVASFRDAEQIRSVLKCFLCQGYEHVSTGLFDGWVVGWICYCLTAKLGMHLIRLFSWPSLSSPPK